MVGKCDAKQSSVELTILQLDWHYTDQLAISYELLVTLTDVLLHGCHDGCSCNHAKIARGVLKYCRGQSILRHSDQALNLGNHLI